MPQNKKIPLSVLVVTKNEAPQIRRCLEALTGFDEVLVVDSASTDNTASIAQQCGVRVVNFEWNGRYPKKRQWCLDHLDLKYDRVFFVDADEVVTEDLTQEIKDLDWSRPGYFVRGSYVLEGRLLRFGLHNNKLALLDRRKMEFPVVDDLHIEGMGEIEGHYQPVCKTKYAGEKPGQLRAPLLHYAYENEGRWHERHERYAHWERGMNARRAWPGDKRFSKRVFQALPCRPLVAFVHSYFLKLGFLDGLRGFRFARSRYAYDRRI